MASAAKAGAATIERQSAAAAKRNVFIVLSSPCVCKAESIVKTCKKRPILRGFLGSARSTAPACLTQRFGKRTSRRQPFRFDSSHCLNHRSNLPMIIRTSAGENKPYRTRKRRRLGTGEFVMARFEILDSNVAPLGEGPASGDMLFELGMMYSVG